MHLPGKGEGIFICKKCGKSFMASGSNVLEDLVGKLTGFPKCPKCGSRNVKRDIRVRY